MRAGLAFAVKSAVGGRNIETIESELVHRALSKWQLNPRLVLVGANRASFWRQHRMGTVSFLVSMLPIKANANANANANAKPNSNANANANANAKSNANGKHSSVLPEVKLRPPADPGAEKHGVHQYAGQACPRLAVDGRTENGPIGALGAHHKRRHHWQAESPKSKLERLPPLSGAFSGGKPFHFDASPAMVLHPHFITQVLNDVYGLQSRSGCSCAGLSVCVCVCVS